MRGGETMSEIRVGENESLDNALKRFKRQCATSGVLKEARKREHYEKPSVKERKNLKKRVERSVQDTKRCSMSLKTSSWKI